MNKKIKFTLIILTILILVSGTMLALSENGNATQKTIERTIVGEWCDSNNIGSSNGTYGITKFFSDGTTINIDYEKINGKNCKKVTKGTYTISGSHMDVIFQGESLVYGIRYTITATKNDTILKIYPDFLPMAEIPFYLMNNKWHHIFEKLDNNVDSIIVKK